MHSEVSYIPLHPSTVQTFDTFAREMRSRLSHIFALFCALIKDELLAVWRASEKIV